MDSKITTGFLPRATCLVWEREGTSLGQSGVSEWIPRVPALLVTSLLPGTPHPLELGSRLSGFAPRGLGTPEMLTRGP